MELESAPPYIFNPSTLIYHDGEGAHRLAPWGDGAEEAVALLSDVLKSLRPSDLRFTGDENIDAILFRRQFDRTGASIFLPGRTSMNLWLSVLGASGEFPDVIVDRMLFHLDEDMLHLHIPTDRGWYHTQWTVIDDLLADGDAASLAADRDMIEDEATLIARWAAHIKDHASVIGESMVVIPGWRDLAMAPLLSIPEVDLQVSSYLGRTALPPDADYERSMFTDLSSVRRRTEIDGSTIYTDGFRSLRISRDGTVRYALVNLTEDDEQTDIPVEAELMLAHAWGFLRGLMGTGLYDLRLVRVEPLGATGEETTTPEGYTFHFAQVFEGHLLLSGEGPVTVDVDSRGIRRAVLAPLAKISILQTVPAITPITALDRSWQTLQDEADAYDPMIRRIQRVHVAAGPSGEDRAIRSAWLVDLGEMGRFLVDAVSGDILERF